MTRDFVFSFIVGLAVGIAYGLIRVKSPAPPIVALVGLLGMVIGETLIMHFRAHGSHVGDLSL